MNYKEYLCNDILNFWLENAIDNKNGGIFTCLDKNGNIYGRDKSVWFQGRALWVFSKVYNVIDKDEKYLEVAKTIYDFLAKCTHTDGRMFFTVTEDGKELQKRRYYYSETFAAIGCAEYYKATGDIKIFEDAEKYFDVAYGVFTGKIKSAPKLNPENAPYKALAPVMIMLSTAQVMRSAGVNSEKSNKIATECLNEIMYGGYFCEEVNALLENVSKDGNFVDTPTGRTANPGHAIEASWFVMMEAMNSGSEEALKFAKKVLDASMELGIDKKHGGLISFCDVNGNPPVALEWDMKLWWPQCEAIIANRLAYEIFGDVSYKEASDKMYDYAIENFADKDNGEWYGYLHYDNTASNTLKGNIFKGPFHLPRMLIFMTLVSDGRLCLFNK